ARSHVVEPAERILQILERRQRIGPALRAGLPIECAGEELSRIAEPLGADAELVPLVHALMAEVGALLLHSLAQAAELLLGQLGDRTYPQLFAHLIVIDRPGPCLDPFHEIDHEIAKARRAPGGRGASVSHGAFILHFTVGSRECLVLGASVSLWFQHIRREYIELAGWHSLLVHTFLS